MGQDFIRRVDGYNLPFFNTVADGTLGRNFAVMVSPPMGPGRAECGYVRVEDLTAYNILSNISDIVVDGVTIFTGATYRWLGILQVAGSTPSVSRVDGATYCIVYWKMNFDFESSFEWYYYNTVSPDPVNVRLGVWGRVGF